MKKTKKTKDSDVFFLFTFSVFVGILEFVGILFMMYCVLVFDFLGLYSFVLDEEEVRSDLMWHLFIAK